MDAVKFLKERLRMTENCEIGCSNCPFSWENNGFADSCPDFLNKHPEKAVEIVEKWSKEHPRKTYLDDFLEKHPNARLGINGLPDVCAFNIGYADSCENEYRLCKDCWNTPIEE